MSQCFTSPNFWGYNFQQIFKGDVKQIPKKGHLPTPVQLPHVRSPLQHALTTPRRSVVKRCSVQGLWMESCTSSQMLNTFSASTSPQPGRPSAMIFARLKLEQWKHKLKRSWIIWIMISCRHMYIYIQYHIYILYMYIWNIVYMNMNAYLHYMNILCINTFNTITYNL